MIGAGIVGCACARECAAAGMRVALIEAGAVAGGATGAAMGHVVVLDDSPAQLALTGYSRGLWRDMRKQLPNDVKYRSPGTIWVAANDEESAESEAKQARFSEAGIDARILSAPELAALEPNLREGLAGGLLVPDDGVLDPRAAAEFYLSEAIRLGAEMIPSRAISAAHGEVQLVNGTQIAGNRIVLAVGTDTDLIAGLPIRRRKGHLALTEARPGFVHHQLVELGYLKNAHAVEGDSVAFNVQPRANGQVLIGSSRQFERDDTEVEPAMMKRMTERATEFMPGLGSLHVEREWSGLRAATADKLPLLGPAKGLPGSLSKDETLWLAMGFEGLGITSSPGAARLLVDGMLGRGSQIDRSAYLPDRTNLLVSSPKI